MMEHVGTDKSVPYILESPEDVEFLRGYLYRISGQGAMESSPCPFRSALRQHTEPSPVLR